MKIENLIEELKRYEPVDETDAGQARQILRLIQSDPTCFDRSNAKGHITGSAWLVDPSGTKVLLTHHKKLDKWLQLGGHADGNPDVLKVAVREAEEESGMIDIRPVSANVFDVDIHRIPEWDTEPEHFHYDIRFALTTAGTTFKISDESHSLAWVDISKIDQIAPEESLLRMARKWKSGHPTGK